MTKSSGKIQGIIVPVLTPMSEDESVNQRELKRQIDRLIEAGVHGIFCLGTNGEGFALKYKEKCEVIRHTVESVGGRVPVFAGTGCVTTAETVALSQFAEENGVDVLSVITPFFAAISQEQLYRHFQEVAKAVRLPVLLYHIPARTGVNIMPETFGRLALLENIVGIKDSSGNFDIMLQYLEAAKESGAIVLSGNDSLILWNLLAGGAGGIAGCANVYPHTLVKIYESFRNGDFSAAREAQDSVQSLRACFQYGNPNTIIKKAVQLLGYDVGECRRPFAGISQTGLEVLKAVLNQNAKLNMT